MAFWMSPIVFFYRSCKMIHLVIDQTDHHFDWLLHEAQTYGNNKLEKINNPCNIIFEFYIENLILYSKI